MIYPLELDKLAEHMHAEYNGGSESFNSVSIDTRTLQAKQLFIAIKGDNFDGHNYLSEAEKKAAVAVLIEKESNHKQTLSIPTIKVENSVQALGQIAKYNRRNFQGKVISVTGTNGKTTVKEMLKSIFNKYHCENSVLATAGNFNNHIGVPLTLLRLEKQHKIAILELGASQIGDIAYTVRLAMPDTIILNNAYPAHLDGFGSLDNIIKAKGEIIEGLNSHGNAVINIDGDYRHYWLKKAQRLNTLTVSIKDSSADVYVNTISSDEKTKKLYVKMQTPVGEISLHLNHLGTHNASNAAAAIATAITMNVDLETIKLGLESSQPFQSRLQIQPSYNNSQLIDDSYNANPASTKAAIDVLASFTGDTILLLGEMAELGLEPEKYHSEIGDYAKQKNIKQLYAIGDLNQNTISAFGANSQLFDCHEDLVNHLKSIITDRSTILVKGSRSSGMEQVIELLNNK